MSTLTRAELARYPGDNPTEQAHFEHHERTRRAKALGHPPLTVERAPVSLPRFLDLRPFPGRDRTERVMAWLVAHTPRAATWSHESLRELSERLACSARVIE